MVTVPPLGTTYCGSVWPKSTPKTTGDVGGILGYGRQHCVALLLGIAGFSRRVVALAIEKPRFGSTPDDASEALEQLTFAHAHQDPVDVVGGRHLFGGLEEED